MKPTLYDYIVLLSCLKVVLLVESVVFSSNLCPSSYLRAIQSDSSKIPVLELVATCFTGNETSHEYRTSTINLDLCFSNSNGVIVPTYKGAQFPFTGGFAETCQNCGLSLKGPYGDDKQQWHVALKCDCDRGHNNGYAYGTVTLDPAVNVNDGVLSCLDNTGAILEYSPSANPPMLPLPSMMTLTTTATINNTVTSTTTATVNSTILSTATDTAITTAISSCESPSRVTVTKTHKGKAHKETVTTRITATSPVTVLVSILVTATPKPTIAAELHSTVVPEFTTIT
ncbi:hypothetical protein F4781DRAFT_46584 [Annulohypoxylon bovei var. microspora]|nr:hypothetical protein F4781DRAFT_46584 [Annulohypoxylon bovei var. microspora]